MKSKKKPTVKNCESVLGNDSTDPHVIESDSESTLESNRASRDAFRIPGSP